MSTYWFRASLSNGIYFKSMIFVFSICNDSTQPPKFIFTFSALRRETPIIKSEDVLGTISQKSLCCLRNFVKPTGNHMYHLLWHKYGLQCSYKPLLCVFIMFAINMVYLTKPHQQTGLYNKYLVCSLWGRYWMCIHRWILVSRAYLSGRARSKSWTGDRLIAGMWVRIPPGS